MLNTASTIENSRCSDTEQDLQKKFITQEVASRGSPHDHRNMFCFEAQFASVADNERDWEEEQDKVAGDWEEEQNQVAGGCSLCRRTSKHGSKWTAESTPRFWQEKTDWDWSRSAWESA